MANAEPPPQETRRRRAAMRSLGIASAAAFAGGVAVVGVQLGVGLVSAGYPPAVQALSCSPVDAHPAAPPTLAIEGESIVPLMQFFAGTVIECRMDAPGADYAIWTFVGPQAGVISGPLDTTKPCQTPEEFRRQDITELRLSSCLRLRAQEHGLYLISTTVMQRGNNAFDRSRIAVRVLPAPEAGAEAAGPVAARLAATLRFPAQRRELTHEADLSASFREHGLVPASRTFLRTVHRLAPEEQFVSATFQARSAANASPVALAYAPDTRAVTARFTLRSGPIVDRWSGWVSGTVVISLTREDPARELALPETSLGATGRVSIPLPERVEGAALRIMLTRPESGRSVELAPGAAGTLDGVRMVARIEGDSLMVEAAPQ